MGQGGVGKGTICDILKNDYDMIFDNDGRLEDLESDFMQFYENAMLGMNTSEIEGEEQ